VISRSGLAKRASTCADCWEPGVSARFFVGRWERRSDDVGTDSGIGSDIVRVCCGVLQKGSRACFSREEVRDLGLVRHDELCM